MKKLSLILALMMIVSLFTGCAADDDAKFTPVVEGKLTVGSSLDFAPYEFFMLQDDGTLKPAGFDISLAQAIADDMGLELVIKNISFDNILMELTSGTIDLAIAGLSPDPERAKSVDFSEAYYTGGQSLVIRTADKAKYTSFASLKGQTVEAQNGSIQMGLAETNTPDAKITGMEKVTDIILDLINGKCEAAFIETAVAENYIKQYPELCIALPVPYEAEGSCVATAKGETELMEKVNATIKEVLENGEMSKFIADANELALSDKAQEISAQ